MLSELQKQIELEKYQQMRLIDNGLMNIAFKDNPEAVEYVIKTILNKPDLTVVTSEIQEMMAMSDDNRSVVMDIVAKDSNGKIYNIEMQNKAEFATEQRARYHCSTIDTSSLKKGQSFRELPESFVIFIVDGSFLGMKHVPIEFFNRYGRRTRRLFKDNQTIVFVNATCKRGKGPLARLMKDLTARTSEEISSKVLKSAVEYAKGEGGQGMYIEGLNSNQEEIWNNGVQYGISQGISQGVAQGTRENQIQTAAKMLKDNLDLELISKYSGLEPAEIKKIKI